MHPGYALLSLSFVAFAACPGKPLDCEHASSERCLWEQGVTHPDPGLHEGEGGGELVGDGGPAVGAGQEPVDQALAELIAIMQLGLEWALVDRRARALCRGLDDDGLPIPVEPSLTDGSGRAWTCPLAGLSLGEHELVLEAAAGVVSLSNDGLDALVSEELAASARARFEPLCANGFEELEGAKSESFYRCPLPAGPFLVIARFPRDPESGFWQVSIAVVDAG